MEYHVVTIDGKEELIVTEFDPAFEDDSVLDDDLNDTIEIPVSLINSDGDQHE